jgi:di/tricarboxylate transporter
MPSQQIVLFGLLGIVLVLLIWGRWRYDFVAFGALVAALVLGVVPADRAFEGFGHPATIIIALVLIVSKGRTNAGIVDQLARLLDADGRPVPLHIGLMSLVAVPLSAVMNNVAALALLMPLDLRHVRLHAGRRRSGVRGTAVCGAARLATDPCHQREGIGAPYLRFGRVHC